MLIAGNWKMNTDHGEAVQLAEDLVVALHKIRVPEAVVTAICPPSVNLSSVGSAILDSPIKLGGQNMHQAGSGAYTGELSGSMLRSVGCTYVILGHSERRQYFQENDALVKAKCAAAREAGLLPIVCVGETLEQRNAGNEEDVVGVQLTASLNGLNPDFDWLPVVAYEPVWAIGTGLTASPEQAQAMHAFIRAQLVTIFGSDLGNRTEILYGGSMKPANALELLSQNDIDGGLIGGASLKAGDFVAIVEAAAHAYQNAQTSHEAIQ